MTKTYPKFVITEDHLTLLRKLRLKTGTVPARIMSTQVISIEPHHFRGVEYDATPTWAALEALGMPYNDENYDYACRLLAELPVAYEAVAASGEFRTGTAAMDPDGAWKDYEPRRAVLYWGPAIIEAEGHDIPRNKLENFIAGAKSYRSPVDTVRDLCALAAAPKPGKDKRLGLAAELFGKKLASRWRTLHPEHAEMPDSDVIHGLLDNSLSISWDDRLEWPNPLKGTAPGTA